MIAPLIGEKIQNNGWSLPYYCSSVFPLKRVPDVTLILNEIFLFAVFISRHSFFWFIVESRLINNNSRFENVIYREEKTDSLTPWVR